MKKRQAKKILKNKDKFQYKQAQIKRAEALTTVEDQQEKEATEEKSKR